jgi:hypothetical protein
VTRLRGLAALAVAALTLASCSSSGDEPRAPGDVVHVRVRFAGAPGFEEQWVELRTGRYRLQSPDGREWWVFDGRRRFEDRISGATTLRIGSRLYLDGLATMSVRELLAAYYLHGRRLVPGDGGHVLALRRHGHTIATITIAGALSSAQADERDLFAIRPALATSIDREVPAGAAPSSTSPPTGTAHDGADSRA